MLHQAYTRIRENTAGDGNRVESVVINASHTITTVYIGSYYEQITTSGDVTTTEWKKVLITCEACFGGLELLSFDPQFCLALKAIITEEKFR